MDLGGISWGLQTVIGVVILAAVLAWALIRNRSTRDIDRDRTERGTRELYREEEARRDPEDDRVP